MAADFWDALKPVSTKGFREYERRVWADVCQIYQCVIGRNLLKALPSKLGSGKPIKIEYITGACTWWPNTNSVLYDPIWWGRKTVEPSQQYVMKVGRTYIYLFHELVHAYHSVCRDYRENAIEEEFRTVGLYEFENELLSENSIRRELKLYRRPCYMWTKHIDALDKVLHRDGWYDEECNRRAARKLPPQETILPRSPELCFPGAASPACPP